LLQKVFCKYEILWRDEIILWKEFPNENLSLIQIIKQEIWLVPIVEIGSI
jgi:hypothetical protein